MKEHNLTYKLSTGEYLNYKPFKQSYILYSSEDKENILQKVDNTEGSSRELAKINIPLSTKCNLNCNYCCEDYSGVKKLNINLSFALSCIKEFVIRTKLQGIKSARLSFDYGGEPTCEIEKLVKISDYFKQCCNMNDINAIVQVSTNGFFNKITCNTLISCVDEIILSLDGNKEMHDENRISKDNKGSFEIVFSNAIQIFSSGKLKYFTSVVHYHTMNNYKDMIDFFKCNFDGAAIRLNPLRLKGAAKRNQFKKISLEHWREFVFNCEEYVKGSNLKLIDTHLKKRVWDINYFGCSSLKFPEWHCRPDNTVSACYELDKTNYIFGKFVNDELYINNNVLLDIAENNVENIEKCNGCIAKYYCSGGCPLDRFDNKINCEKRRENFVKQLLNSN